MGGVEGLYTCDGGCDKATVTQAYADAIIKAGGSYQKYDRPLLTTLADGEVKPIITGFIRADVEVTTPAGKVVLANWHVDFMQGPTNDRLLYMGQREERELNLKSYKDQLTELARGSKPGHKQSVHVTDSVDATNTRVQINGKMRKVVFNPGQQPIFKRRLARKCEGGATRAKLLEDGWDAFYQPGRLGPTKESQVHCGPTSDRNLRHNRGVVWAGNGRRRKGSRS